MPALYKVWLFTLLGLFSSTCLSAQCEASYVFEFVNHHTVLFFNNSENYSGQKWEFEDGISFEDNSPLVTYTFESDTNTVCLRVWTDNGCEDLQCFDVYPGAPNEMCSMTDCVWPGDANRDAKANHLDVLTIGLGFGANGPQRPFFPNPANPIDWMPNISDNWETTENNINFKHLDCDGNGTVDVMDLEAIDENYEAETEVLASPVTGAPMIEFEFQEDSIFFYNVNEQETFEIHLDVNLGSNFQSFENLYGLAFELAYPGNIVANNPILMLYNSASFMGDETEVMTFDKKLDDLERYDVAITRLNGLGAGGFGNVGTITFIISSDIIGGYFDPHIPFELDIVGLTAIDENGGDLDIDLQESVSMTIVRDIVASPGASELSQQIQVFPNPVSDELWIELGRLRGEKMILYDILGQQRIVNQIRGSRHRVPVAHLPSGIYLLSIYTEEGTLTKQIHVE